MRKVILLCLMFCYLTFIKANNPGYLGISIKDFSNKQTVGVLVVNVFDDGAAKQYGLKENDIITAINSVAVVKNTDLTTQLARYNWSDKVHLDIVRNGVASYIDVYLGYKGTTRTYNVKKVVKPDGEHWLFADDNTDFLLDANNQPVSISRKYANDKVDTWQPSKQYKQDEIPQYFLDLEDKLYCINRIKEEQTKRNSKASDIVFIKERPSENQEKIITQPELITLEFSISPNPSKGQFLVTGKLSEKGNAQILIFDITGRIVKSEVIDNMNGEFSKQFNLENEPKGAYLLQLKVGDKTTSKKIILQ